MHLSPSQIDRWFTCPKQYEYIYILGQRKPPSGALTLGSSFHEATDHNFEVKMETGEDAPVDEVLDVFGETFDNLEPETEWELDEDPAEIKDLGYKMTKIYREKRAPEITPVAVEPRIEIPFDNTDYSLVVIPDLIDSQKFIRDYKTSNRKKSEDEVSQSLQLTAQSLAYRWHFGEEEGGLGLEVVVKNKTPQIQTLETFRSQADIDRYLETLGQVAALIQTGIFPRKTEGWHCSRKFCGFYDECMASVRTYSIT